MHPSHPSTPHDLQAVGPAPSPSTEPVSRPVSVERLTFPIGVTVGIFLVLVGGVTSVAGVWYKTLSHTSDVVIHLDQAAAVVGGGPAYKQDVERGLQAQYQKTRRLLHSMQLHCAKVGEGFGCRVELPDVE